LNKTFRYIAIGAIVALLILVYAQERAISKLKLEAKEAEAITNKLVIKSLELKQENRAFLDSTNAKLGELQLSRDSLAIDYERIRLEMLRYKNRKYNYDTLSNLEKLNRFNSKFYKR
jgi:hypothetical protein